MKENLQIKEVVKMDIVERFLKYVAFDTSSDESSSCCPSNEKELCLAEFIAEDLKTIGCTNAHVDDFGYVYAYIPASKGFEDEKPIGFIAHMDTSPDAPGADIKVKQFIYNGGDIVLKNGLIIGDEEYNLSFFKGQELICTDGTTLLGADDKAGASEIVTAFEYLLCHPELNHGDLYVALTPDEEIGRGTDKFDLNTFRASYAYTVDGGRLGEIEYECFNAASVKITVHGLNIHPGSAKNKMRNSIIYANEFLSMLPPSERPEHTEGYEGFYHVNEICGDESETKISIIIRDHDTEKFKKKKQFVLSIAKFLNDKYGPGTLDVEIVDSYYNMKDKILPHMHIIRKAEDAFKKEGIEPCHRPIRGGTDGARLSYEGLPCPNLSTGGENFHSVKEFVSINAMNAMVNVIVNIASDVSDFSS